MTNTKEPEDMFYLGDDFMLTPAKIELIISALLWFGDTWKHLPSKQRDQLEDLLAQFKFIHSVMAAHKPLEDIHEQVFGGTK